MRIGVDVGGTNTDAVLMDGTNLLSLAKHPTSTDTTSGIIAAFQEVLKDTPQGQKIQAVMLGTTHFTNALLEHKGLASTAVLRLALPATTLLPPLVDWPSSLREAVCGSIYLAHGGHEFDGREISALDESEIREAARAMRRNGIQAVAINGIFSSVDPSHEKRAAEILADEFPDLRITLAHEIGRVGILERENAAALNASLSILAEQTIKAIHDAINSLGITAPLYLSQNDGTLMDSQFASQYPVFTIASGPTNSMRGAAFLSGVRDGIVVDIGGTSTDVGALVSGFPREASVAVKVGDVRTNFRMPDVLSIALGGGSLVDEKSLTIGPESVGYRLSESSLVFGGDKLTSTDLAVAGGLVKIGDPSFVRSLDAAFVKRGLGKIKQLVEDVVDQVKLSAGEVPVVLVGGGSILLPNELAGASEVLRPPHAEVANAIGAAIAQAGGQIEKVYSLDGMTRDDAVKSAHLEAVEKAVEAGADPNTTEVVEIDEIPLTYLPSNAIRIRAKAVGDLSM